MPSSSFTTCKSYTTCYIVLAGHRFDFAICPPAAGEHHDTCTTNKSNHAHVRSGTRRVAYTTRGVRPLRCLEISSATGGPCGLPSSLSVDGATAAKAHLLRHQVADALMRADHVDFCNAQTYTLLSVSHCSSGVRLFARGACCTREQGYTLTSEVSPARLITFSFSAALGTLERLHLHLPRIEADNVRIY